MKPLLIDVGSTNIKYKIYGIDTIYSVPFPFPILNKYPYYEVDPIKITKIITNIIDEVKPTDVYFSVQMHGYILLNKGIEVTNYISWRDERAKDIIPQFNINSEYGVSIKPNLPRLSIELQNISFDEFMTLGSYISYKLTGNNSSHITDIAPTGFYNMIKMKYDDEPFKLPKVEKYVTLVGTYNSINIYTPVGDHQLSIFGANKESYNEYILNLGTACQICTVSNKFISGDYETRPYFNNKYLLTVTGLPGGGYIKSREISKELEDELFYRYKDAIDKLPKRGKIKAIGGLLNSRKELIENVLKRLNIDYILSNECDALKALEYIVGGKIK